MKSGLQAHLRTLGSQGGKKSRRTLDPATARKMVAVREARKAYREHRHRCFWSYRDDADTRLGVDDIPWVIDGLMNEGNRAIFEQARRIKRLLRETPSCH